VTRYRIFADLDVIEALRGIRMPERRQIAAFLEELKDSPDTEGDFTEKGASDRDHSIKIVGKWAVTYWTDHPAKEVKIERIDRADG
jgi:hypothetical protein